MNAQQIAITLGIMLAIACSSGRSKPAPPSNKEAASAKSNVAPVDSDVFAPDRVLSVDITLPAEQWSTLRANGRDAASLATECEKPPKKLYSFHKATVTIDGTHLASVGVRKKGFLGSLSVLRPSLKLKFDRQDKGQRYQGMRRLTLNNNKQDKSLMRTCLVYKVFRDAKVPAPRCNFARVTVNGESLGIYSNVESMKKPFLARHFADASGTLYEGQLAGFAKNWLTNLDQKTNKKKPDRDALARVMAALNESDAKLLRAISALIDYDQFLTFWALETLTGHWDGYTSNRNNYYIYKTPADGKLRFIPWGADIGFTNTDPFRSGKRPATVSAGARLARRLYKLPQVRADYMSRMRLLLDTVWNEGKLLAEVDRIDALLGGTPDDEGVAEIKKFITTRRKTFDAELAAGGGDWNEPLRETPCYKEGASIAGTFDTTFGNLDAGNPMTKGKASLTLSLGGKPIELAIVGAVSGLDKNVALSPAVRLVGMANGSIYVLQLVFEDPLFKSGTEQQFHGFATWGMLIELVNMRDFKLRGFVGTGNISLETAGIRPGASVKGSFSGTLYESPGGAF